MLYIWYIISQINLSSIPLVHVTFHFPYHIIFVGESVNGKSLNDHLWVTK